MEIRGLRGILRDIGGKWDIWGLGIRITLEFPIFCPYGQEPCILGYTRGIFILEVFIRGPYLEAALCNEQYCP